MAILSELKPYPGAKRKHKRLGQGEGSGRGQTAGRGMKGQRSRSGDGKQTGFEGGQNPIFRRVPKRGFNHPGRDPFQPVNLSEIARAFEGQKLADVAAIRGKGLSKGGARVKILGDGEAVKGLTIEAHAFSKSAVEKIEKAGGKAVIFGAKRKVPAKNSAKNAAKAALAQAAAAKKPAKKKAQ
jgi:large subunit ribosomal protein L15